MSMGQCTDFATALVCYDDGAGNLSTLIAHYEYGKTVIGSTILAAVRYTDAAGTPVDTSAPGGVVSAGACPIAAPVVPILAGGTNIAAGAFAATHDPGGNGDTYTHAGGYQSMTVVATEAGQPGSGNTIEVVLDVGSVFLVKGESRTWSVVGAPYALQTGPTVRALGNSAASIGWTV